MKTIPRLSILALTASTLIALCPAHATEVASSIFEDAVNYSGWNTGPLPMEVVWKSKSGSRPNIITITPDNPGFELNNGVIFTRLPRNIGTDFELSFDALHTSFSRLIWAGLFNAEGTQGYVIAWDSGLAKYFNTQGVVSIRKFDVEPGAPALRFNTGGTLLSKPQASGHNPGNDTTAAIAEPYAKLKLTWQSSTHTLRLYVDGALMQTVIDSSFISFSSLYVAGGTGSRFDNILVASPLASPTSGNAR
jgi:hypothetical protein